MNIDKASREVIMTTTLILAVNKLPLAIPEVEQFCCDVKALSSTDDLIKPESTIAPAEFSPAQMSAYLLELEGLLHRVDSATTHYQVLGVDRSAGQQEIKTGFHQLIELLYPQYAINRNIPAAMISRIDRAFQRASRAFAALAGFAKRREYDAALASVTRRPKEAGELPRRKEHQPKGGPAERAPRPAPSAASGGEINAEGVHRTSAAYVESSRASSTENRRRCPRIKMSIPVRVTGYDRQNGKWNEMTETIDVSRTGLRLRLRKRIKHGMVLHLTLPLPTKLRSHGFGDASYSVYTFVRTIEPSSNGTRAVSLEFIGGSPPPGFLQKPWSVFRVKRWAGNERRRPNREDRSEWVRIEYLDHSMHSMGEELAKTENVSRSGIRLVGTQTPPEFDFVMLNCEQLSFHAMASLRNRYVGKDGFERLCLQLIDSEWPTLSRR